MVTDFSAAISLGMATLPVGVALILLSISDLGILQSFSSESGS
jgi:hypothetical protein